MRGKVAHVGDRHGRLVTEADEHAALARTRRRQPIRRDGIEEPRERTAGAEAGARERARMHRTRERTRRHP